MNQDTYEIWIERIGHLWSRAKVGDEDLWGDKEEATDVAGDFAEKEGVLQVIVIERKPIIFINGPARATSERSEVVNPPRMIGNSE